MKSILLEIKKKSLIVIFIILVLSGCAPKPILLLKHSSDSQGYEYNLIGTITVADFEDKRDISERIPLPRFGFNKEFFRPNPPTLLSQQTQPGIDDFLKEVLETEIKASGIFTINPDSYPEYELTGKINSFKNVHVLGNSYTYGMLLQIVGTGLVGIGNLTVPTNLGVLVIGAAVLIPAGVLYLTNKNDVITTVDFDVVLKRHGVEIWSDNINVAVYEKYSYYGQWPQKVLDASSVMVDRAVTQAVRELIKRIDKNING